MTDAEKIKLNDDYRAYLTNTINPEVARQKAEFARLAKGDVLDELNDPGQDSQSTDSNQPNDMDALIRQMRAENRQETTRDIAEQQGLTKQRVDELRRQLAERKPVETGVKNAYQEAAAVPPPKLEKPPQAPNTLAMIQPSNMQRTMGMASIFALLSVGIAKGSATYALKGFGGFLEGAHQGNLEQARASLADFNAGMDQVREANRVAMQDYNNIIGNKKLSIEAQERELRIKALEFQDTLTIGAIEQGGMNAVHARRKDLMTADHNWSMEAIRLKQMEQSLKIAQMKSSGAGGAGGLNTIFDIPIDDIPVAPPGQKNEQFLSMLSPARQDIIRRITDGKLDIHTLGGFGKESSMIKRNYVEAAALYDPAWRQQSYGVIDKALKEGTPGGRVGANVLAVNVLPHHLDDYVTQFAKLNNSQVQRWNQTKNKLATEFGDPALNQLKVPLGFIAGETAKIVKGGNASPTEDEIKYWNSVYDTSASPAQMRAVVWQSLQGVGGRLSEVETAMRASTNNPNYRALSDDALKLILKNKPEKSDNPDWLQRYAKEGRGAKEETGTPQAESKPPAGAKILPGYIVATQKSTGKKVMVRENYYNLHANEFVRMAPGEEVKAQ